MNNGNNKFNWSPDRWQRINTLVHDEAARIRVARRVLPLFGNSTGYEDSVVLHQVSAGPPLFVRPGQRGGASRNVRSTVTPKRTYPTVNTQGWASKKISRCTQ